MLLRKRPSGVDGFPDARIKWKIRKVCAHPFEHPVKSYVIQGKGMLDFPLFLVDIMAANVAMGAGKPRLLGVGRELLELRLAPDSGLKRFAMLVDGHRMQVDLRNRRQIHIVERILFPVRTPEQS